MWPFNGTKERVLQSAEVDCAGDAVKPPVTTVPCADCGELPGTTISTVPYCMTLNCFDCEKRAVGNNLEDAVAKWNKLNAEDEELLYKSLQPCPYCDEIPYLTMDDTGKMTLGCDKLRHVSVSPETKPLHVAGRCASNLRRKWNSEIDRRGRMDIKLDRTAQQLLLADDPETGEENDHDSKDA